MASTEVRTTGFWSRAATWKAFLLVVVYLAFYLAVGFVVDRVFADQIDDDNLVGTAASIFFGVTLPIAVGALALLLFTARVGWLADVFGAQPVRGHGWMWIAPVLVSAAIVAHLAGADWDSWTGGELVALAFLGVCVGVAEELVTRGLTVKILRDAGHGERYVAVVSSLVFALMHTSNAIGGMALSTVAVTVVYTFGFGMCMYLSMRVTGTIWAAIVLHGLTDPTTLLSTGGVDEAVLERSTGASTAAELATFLLVGFAIVAVFLVRGGPVRASEAAPASA